jgi:hypothetical protein
VKVETWTWASEHEQVNKIKYFINIKRILKEYSLTHDIQYIMMWRNIYHVYMDEQLKKLWKIKMDEHNLLQPRVMRQCKLYLFTTKRSMLTETLPIHLQEACSHWLLNNMRLHILSTISHCFVFEFNSSNLLHLRSFLPLKEENYILSPISTQTY